MVPPSEIEYYRDLVVQLCSLPHETEWVEFKENFTHNDEIGEYISALSNGAALNHRPYAYLIWGVEDQTHNIVGTNFNHAKLKQGNEPLENWLLRMLRPQIEFRFHELDLQRRRIVVLEITAASYLPVAFNNTEFIRVGSVKKELRYHPEKERALWRIFEHTNFEEIIASERVSDEVVIRTLNCPAYFELLDSPFPEGTLAILDALRKDGLIIPCDAGGWYITNLGGILLARNLDDFPRLGRKALRVIQHDGVGRIQTQREHEFNEGYAVSFQRIVDYVMALTPASEVIEQSLRRSAYMFPEIAVRELVANALIHQDLQVTGAGPIVEIFDDRVEITNPGKPLVDPDRFVDSMSNSRNEQVARLMRRFRICEERGSGIDRVVHYIEAFQLPAPLFQEHGDFTRATIFSPKPLVDMDKTERVRACYLHACLRYVTHQSTNNTSIRARFGLPDERVDTASRLLREAVESRLIIIQDPSSGLRNRAYLPFWAT